MSAHHTLDADPRRWACVSCGTSWPDAGAFIGDERGCRPPWWFNVQVQRDGAFVPLTWRTWYSNDVPA